MVWRVLFRQVGQDPLKRVVKHTVAITILQKTVGDGCYSTRKWPGSTVGHPQLLDESRRQMVAINTLTNHQILRPPGNTPATLFAGPSRGRAERALAYTIPY